MGDRPTDKDLNGNGSSAATAMSAVAIDASNSLDFLAHAFRLFDERRLFTVVRKGVDAGAYPGLSISDTVTPAAGGGWGQLRFTPSDSDAPAQILFSSGTEGLPKPIVLSPRNISDVVRRLNAAMEVDETIREYIGVPVTYSFGLGRARAVSAAGGRIFLPERFDPAQIREMLEAGEINAISAVPTLWRLVLAQPEAIGAAGERVRWIEIGSQYMSGAEKAALRRLFPNARIVQHYGLTEASRTTFLTIDDAGDDALESVGSATPPAEVRIGEAGEVCIRGDHVALGVLGDTGEIRPVTGDDGWLHTKDRGEIRDGRLHFLGRLDDMMNVAGVNLGAERLEAEIAALCGCAGLFAVSGVADPLRGDAVLLAVTAEARDRTDILRAAAALALKRNGIDQSGSLRVMEVEALPVTGNGKVQRSKLREAFTAPDPHPAPLGNALSDGLSEAEARVSAVWQSVIGAVPISPSHTFYDSGGDSLSAVQIGLQMERSFGRAATRATLEGRTLAEVAMAVEGTATDAAALPRKTQEAWALNAARGLMVLVVLVSHWGPGLFGRFGVAEGADRVLGFVYQMGTQGFTTVFGIGIGYYFLRGYPANRSSVVQRLWSAFLLVLAGLALMGFIRLLLFALEGREMTGDVIASAFYNVLAYYVLALATVRIWLELLSGERGVIARTLLAVILCFPILYTLRWLMPDVQSGLTEWPRLMLVAKYSYFHISPLVFGGIAVGYWFSGATDPGRAARLLLGWGMFLAALMVCVGIQLFGTGALTSRSSPFFGSRVGDLFYFGLATGLLGGFLMMTNRWTSIWPGISGVLKGLIVLGGLALPIYAFHGVVIPVKDILVTLGVGGVVALVIPVAVFLTWLGWAFLRLRRMYF